MRVAIYARFSSDRQNERSIEDQIRLCRERARADEGDVVAEFSDAEISGASRHNRPGLLDLLARAGAREFDTVLAEDLDRIARNAEDQWHVFNQLTHFGIGIVTLSDGAVSDLHVGLKGMMGQMFLKRLAESVRRGQRGALERGAFPAASPTAIARSARAGARSTRRRPRWCGASSPRTAKARARARS